MPRGTELSPVEAWDTRRLIRPPPLPRIATESVAGATALRYLTPGVELQPASAALRSDQPFYRCYVSP